jgi:GR25 family glycosyltransferase involved in LPS biosynthesis
MLIKLNKEEFKVSSQEFNKVHHDRFQNLHIIPELGICERIISLIEELSCLNIDNCIFSNITQGGFIPIKCSNTYKNIHLLYNSYIYDKENFENIKYNIEKYKIQNISFNTNEELSNCLYFSSESFDFKQCKKYNFPIMLIKYNQNISNYFCYELVNSGFSLYIPNKLHNLFIKEFHYYIKPGNKLVYDNLINLCVMVKNGGDLFKEMLIENLDIIDRWTILDTGSTDNTIENVNNILVGKKKGRLYQEPFINFRDSRNRCLDLAGTECKYNLMLDDTYISRGNLRNFLEEIRGDQNGDSYSLTIKSTDVEYLSNRITKSKNKLRYIYTMHEIIQDADNLNIGVPTYVTHIEDKTNTFMSDRSDARKQYDLKCLYEMIDETPDEPRHVYYIAQTYKMMKNYKKASEYYYKRAFHKNKGFDQEQFDALFEFARTNLLYGNSDWGFLERYFKLCTFLQPTRPEGDFFIAVHYYTIGKKEIAFEYFKRAHKIGFPSHQQYSLKPTINYLYTPFYLAELCYLYDDHKLGLECTNLYFYHNKPDAEHYKIMTDWHHIYVNLNKLIQIRGPIIINDNPIFCFIADGGFTKWSGKNILTSGVGGSETWVIEMARYIKQLTNFDVYVFCNCEENEIFEGVKYHKLNEYFEFISKYQIKYCFISRFSEYIPVTIKSNVENIYVILHDIVLSGSIIPIDNKIKNIFCLTESHKNDYLMQFPQFGDRMFSLHYGIDFTNFLIGTNNEKIKNSFIYSSFPNRGLITLLKMWPYIQFKYPDATLNIFTDVNNQWANNNFPEELKEIRTILDLYKTQYPNIVNRGWVDKKTLAQYWKKSQIWFYPCKFKETFCLTALEAAITKTLAITNDLGSLVDTVGDRGVIIPGNTFSKEWIDEALSKIIDYLDNPNKIKEKVERNFEWALKHSWKDRCKYFLENFVFNDNSNPNIELIITEKNDNNPLNKIDKVYYINLKEREDRKNHFLQQCNKVNISNDKIQRFEAINGSNYSFSHDELLLFDNCNYKTSQKVKSIMGNQLSHFKIFQEMIIQNYNYIIVCQDDIVFKENFCNYIDELIEDVIDDCEIIFFGFHKFAIRDVFLPWDLYNDEDLVPSITINRNLCKLKSSFDDSINCNNSLGYILTLNGAKNFVNHIYQKGFTFATDFEYNSYLIKKNIFYTSKNVLATSNPNLGSDIFDNIYNKKVNENNINYNNYFLNYYGQFNWSNDFPDNTNSKLQFVKNLTNFTQYNDFNVIEIGCFVGTSIISILQYMTKNIKKVVAIDSWEDPIVENIFIDNLKKSGYTNTNISLRPLKGVSLHLLMQLIKENNSFDFIHITQTHNSVNLFMDLFLSWNLLSINGILAINNIYNKETITKNINEFLDSKKNEYENVESNTTIFIKKKV